MNLAFISYSHHDAKVADWLQTRLEHYHLPNNMPNPVNPQSHYLRPIFRDRTDLTTGVLSEIIDRNLENSKFLILICSRRSARSEWVSKEVQYFIEHGRINHIIPLVIDGIPYSRGPRECMPKYMLDFVSAHPDQELLCIDRVADGDDRAFMQIVSRLMDVPFDVMFARHRRRRNHILGTTTLFSTILLGAAGYLITPVSTSIQFYDLISHLPHQEGTLIVDGQTYSIPDSCYSSEIQLQEMPGFRRGGSVEVTFMAPFYDTIQTTLPLSIGFSTLLELDLVRDETFSHFKGVVIDMEGKPVVGANVDISGYQAETDANGSFHLKLPPKAQQMTQPIYITKAGYQEIYREDEEPDQQLKYILHPSE